MLSKDKLTNLWKKEVISILNITHPEQPLEIKIKFVEDIFTKYYQPAIGDWRCIYQYTDGSDDIDDLLIDILINQNIIAANGSVVYNYQQVPSLIYNFLNNSEVKRKYFKKLLLEAVEAGDKIGARDYDATQYKYKERMNSAYGVQTQRGSIVANTDSASAITIQSRELISEMMWSIEKFLAGNMCFYNSNELYQYLEYIMNQPWINPDLLNEINYIPTVDDCINKFKRSLFEMADKTEFIQSEAYKKIINYLSKLSDENRIKYFYKDNLYDLILNNSIFNRLFFEIFENSEEFYNPYDIPESYKNTINKLWALFDNFVFSKIPTYKRAEKYVYRTRKAILMSDTDSIMISLNQFMNYVYEITGKRYNITSNHSNRYKIVNTISSILSKVCDVMCYKIGEEANTEEKERFRLSMKNEFYFLRMILFAGVKKNYVTLAGLREGKKIPDKDALISVGAKLTSSNLIPEIQERINYIIKEKMLIPLKINPIELWKEVTDLENFIKNEILSGNKYYVLRAKYGGMKQGYANPEGHEIYRGVTIWNRLYPEYKIESGELVFKIKTKIKTKEDVDKYINDPVWKEKVLDLVFDVNGQHKREFNKQDFSSYGLSSICINSATGLPEKIPEWIIPAIELDSIVEMHTRSIVDLLASVGLHQTKINSKRSKLSTMINF